MTGARPPVPRAGAGMLPGRVLTGWLPGACLLAACLLSGCAGTGDGRSGAGHASSAASAATSGIPGGDATARPSPPDPPTMAALLRIAQVFNSDYGSGRYGAAYDRWDPRSRAIISRAEYIRRHQECQTAPLGAPVRVQDATRGPGGRWLVGYAIDGVQHVDTWYYLGRRWVFDIVLSNPDAARQYRLPFARYAVAVGCTRH